VTDAIVIVMKTTAAQICAMCCLSVYITLIVLLFQAIITAQRKGEEVETSKKCKGT